MSKSRSKLDADDGCSHRRLCRSLTRCRRSLGTVRPAKDAERAERDPSARTTLSFVEVHQQLVVMSMFERPAAVGVTLRFDDADRLGGSLVRRDPGGPHVVERAQDVVVPTVREREVQPTRVRHLAGRQPSVKTPPKEVLGKPTIRAQGMAG